VSVRGAAVALLLALAAVGCGGGGDDGTAELAAEANPICERANGSLAGLAQPESLEGLLRYVEQATGIVRTRTRELRALSAPDDSAEQWAAFLAANDRALEALDALRESTVTGRGGEEAIREFESAEAAAREAARQLGLDSCSAQPPQPEEEEDEEPTTTSAAPQTRWAEEADAICSSAQGQIDALPQPTDPISAAAQVGQVAGIVKREIGDLRELEPPPGERARVQRFLAALGRGANALDRLVQAMTNQDEDAVDRYIEEGEVAATEAQREADALGLTVCGRG
jgi:hypothetical protein